MSRGKPRTILKKSGKLRHSVCKHCGAPDCDPMMFDHTTPAGRKIDRRKQAGECIGCGKKECQCKNTNRGWRG